MTKRLTDKQRLFVLEYVVCLNATEAARRAGYKGNSNTLRAVGNENLTKPAIRSEIDRLLQERTMPAAEVLVRLSEHASGNLADFIDIKEDGGIAVDFKAAKENGKLHLLKKLTFTKEGKLQSIELHDPQAALVHLGRAYALFTERHEIDDWRSQAIRDIRKGDISYPALANAFDPSLADELFKLAGVPIAVE